MDLNSTLADLKTKSFISNQYILDIFDKVTKSKVHKYKDIVCSLPDNYNFNTDSFRSRIHFLKTQRKKYRLTDLQNFLNRQFLQPTTTSSSSASNQPVISPVVKSPIKECRASKLEKKRKLKESFLKKAKECNSKTRKIKQLTTTLENKRRAYKILKLKNAKLRKKVCRENVPQQESAKGDPKKLKNKVKKLNIDKDLLSKQILDLKKETKESNEQIKDLKENQYYLQTLLKDNDDDSVYLFDKNKNMYTPECQQTIMNLLSEGVGVHHINNVMTSVSNLCNKNLNQLPSTRTINRIGDQRLSLAQMQIAEKLQSKEHTTLMTDETRKYGQSYEMFSVQDDEGTQWVMGLKEMNNKSAQTCLDTFKYILNEIDITTESTCGKRIVANIKNTMSDSAATEKKFHNLLQTYREEILPDVYSNWDELTEDEQTKLVKLNNFYCGLHLLVNFAEIADSVILRYEKLVQEVPVGAGSHPETARFISKSESASIRLLRTTAKCLAKGADEKNGCYKDFHSFMLSKNKDENLTKDRANMLQQFRGNRFNIIFYNAEITFYLAPYIKEFFADIHLPSNTLQKAVNYDLCEDNLVVVAKALGLCSKLITAPFWRIMESDCSMQETSNTYQVLSSFFCRCKEDVSAFICGEDVPFPTYVKDDFILQCLLKEHHLDTIVATILKNLFTAWETILIKSAGDHLIGGQYETIGPEMETETKSVPKHNKFPERVFALLDALTRFRPVATTLCNESYIMFSLNKTYNWITSLPEKERDEYLQKARSGGRLLREKFIHRSKELECEHQQSLKKKREDIARKRDKAIKDKEDIVNEIQYWGFWQYTETLHSSLNGLKGNAQKKKALKAQLRFRKLILEQIHSDSKIFQFSERGKDYSVEVLSKNLEILIKSALENRNPNTEDILIGKKIKHYFMENDDRIPYLGRVISTVPGYPKWMNVTYDNDNAVYVYQLHEEFKNGDLEIVPEVIILKKLLFIFH